MKKKVLDEIKHWLVNREEILFAYALGTFLNNDDFNDIDIAVYIDESKLKEKDVFDYEIDMSLKLEESIKPGEKFKRYVPIDVKVINFAPLGFKYSVSTGVLLFSRDERIEDIRAEFLSRTWKMYFDFRYMANVYLREALNAEAKY
jgi:predicted nucleotidyltransferase